MPEDAEAETQRLHEAIPEEPGAILLGRVFWHPALTGVRQEEEMKLDWGMQAGHRLCGLVGLGPGTVVRCEGKLAP